MSITGPRREATPSRFPGGDRGSVAVSVILIPLALLVVFGTIHLALVLHGRNVAEAAAQDALFAASQFGATQQDGEAAANRTLDLFQGIQGATVSVVKTEREVRVSITGEVTTPLHYFSGFTVEVIGPNEEFLNEAERIAG